MKKCLLWLLIAAMLISLFGCTPDAAPEDTQPSESGSEVLSSGLVGAPTAKKLVERVVEYLNNGANFEKIADLYDYNSAVAFSLGRMGVCESWEEAQKAALAIEAGMDTLKRDYPDVAEKLAAHLNTPVDDTALEVFDSLKELDYVKPMSEEYAPVTHTYDEFNLNTVEDTFYEYTFYVGTKQETVDQLHIEFLRRDGKYYLVFIEPSAV